MMISLILTVGFFSLFLLPLTCISILFSLRSDHLHRHLSSNAAKLGSVCTLLLRHTLFPVFSASKINEEVRNDAVGERRYSGPREECRVCLSEVEEGEEIGELRCCHVFHKICLDAWVGSGHATCPLCRGRVFSPAVAEDDGSEVIMFRFCSLSGSRRAATEDGWWLR